MSIRIWNFLGARKAAAIASLALGAILLAPCGLAAAPPSAQAPAHGGEHGPMPAPKNLQVLPKTMPVEDLLKIMHSYNQELGVHCTFCHEQKPGSDKPDFASDAKPEKTTARIMMRMMHDMNDKYMTQIHDPDAKPEQTRVHCSTCHRGQSMPAVWTAAAQGSMPAKP